MSSSPAAGTKRSSTTTTTTTTTAAAAAASAAGAAAPSPKRVKASTADAAAHGFCDLTFSMVASKGLKNYQQDMPVAVPDLTLDRSLNDTRYAYFAVYDGHAGDFCSKYLQEHLHGALADDLDALLKGAQQTGVLANKEKEKEQQLTIKKAFVNSFKRVDKKLCSDCVAYSHEDGSCAITLLVRGNVCWIGNVGDSKAVLCRVKDGERKALPLSKDHSPLLLKERQRIEKAGATVEDGRVNGRLGVSRSFGDTCVKKAGVTAQPDITKFTITSNEKFAVLACDGLWSVFTVRDCVDWVAAQITHQWEIERENATVDTGLVSKKRSTTPVQDVCRRVNEELIKEATIARKCKDNCTAIVLLFGDGY